MSDLDRILKLASHGTDRAQSQAPVEREMKEEIPATTEEVGTTEAVGEFADPILDLCDDLGCDSDHPVLGELIRYLDGDTIKDFVADFRRHNDMNHPGEDGDYGDDDENFEEGNEFSGELEKARKEGKKEFKVDGKTYQVENYQDRYNKVASTANAIKVGKSNATMPQDAVRKVSGDSSYTHADNPFYAAKADARKNDGLGVNGAITKRMKPGADGKFKWGRDKLADSTVQEGTWAVPETPEQVEKLKEVMSEPLLVGADGDNACDVMYGLLGDDELFDTFHEMSVDMGPDADARPAIEARLKELGLMETEIAEGTLICKDCGDKLHNPTTDCDNDCHDESGDHWVNEETVNEAQSQAQKDAFAKMLASKKGAKKDDEDDKDDKVEEAVITEKCGTCGCDMDHPKPGCDCDSHKKENIEEAPTMDTTQLINLMKNSGLSEEKIKEKLDEWANTPAGAAEEEATSHGEPYENFAQSVNLSLKRYLDAEDMKVGLKEHKVEDIKEAYKTSKNKK